jgi:metal-responsive CopG/Arc/MetJ family transcriptional regulator
MIAILIRLPESLLTDIDKLVNETYTNRSVFIRQSILRNLDIIQNVERPAIREHYKQRLPKLH